MADNLEQGPGMIPPNDLDSEQSVLGSMMLSQEALAKGIELLLAEDFYRPTHSDIFRALGSLAQRGEPVDLIILQEELRRRDKLEECGSTDYLMALVEKVPTAANIEHYAAIVANHAETRRVIDRCRATIGLCLNNSIHGAASLLLNEARDIRSAEQKPLECWDYEELLLSDIEDAEFVVDRIIPRKNVSLITGVGGVGKSWVGYDLALSVAHGGKFLEHFETIEGPVLVLDWENSDKDIIKRNKRLFLSRIESESIPSKLPIHIFRKPNEEDLDRNRIFIDNPGCRARLCRLIEEVKPVLVILDALVCFHEQDENDSGAMRNKVFVPLAAIARTYNCAIVVMHHVRKRGAENDSGEMIRGSSDIRNAVASHLAIGGADSTRFLVKHDKSRECPAIDKFTFERIDGENGQTYQRYVGTATETIERETAARELIMDALMEKDEVGTGELKVRAKAQDVKERTIDRALAAMVRENLVANIRRGKYTLAKNVPARMYYQDGDE